MDLKTSPHMTEKLSDLVKNLHEVGVSYHGSSLFDNARNNSSRIKKSINDISALDDVKQKSAIIVSAGPCVKRRNSIKRIKESNYKGTIICVDGSYIACLKEGLIPDFVMTLDPHPTRIVAWFGGGERDRRSNNDDYFERQDLNVDFNELNENLDVIHRRIVDEHAHQTRAIVSTTAPKNVAERIEEAGFDAYWFNPLCDDPSQSDSITRELYRINEIPCINTGGTVGSASWVFVAETLKIPNIAVVGMDLGYYLDTPINKTQTYYELVEHLGSEKDVEQYFCEMTFPLTGEKFYTDVTFSWYRRNLLQLLRLSDSRTYNCTEGGTLFGDDIKCIYLDDFLKDFS